MRDNTNKYFVLMGMLLLTLLGIAAVFVILFFILKLFAVSMFNIPGSSYLFELGITIIPSFILFGAYYLVHKKISAGKTNASAVAARILLTAGSLVCIAQLVISVLWFANVRTTWMELYNEHNKAAFALHLILILISAGVLATGDPKEKNWMERSTDQ